MGIEFIGQSKAGKILLFLYKCDGNKAYFSQISKAVGGSTSTINVGIFILKEKSLVGEEIEEKFGGKRYIFLTEKGKKVAEYLMEIERIMEEG